MSSKIFQTILDRKIDNFVNSFVIDSNSIFYKNDLLIHPGEYGRYRENALKELLKILIPSNLKISDGFVITSNDKVSTQCDIVIYNSDNMPLLNDGISQFFSIESVLVIGEVKSDLKKNKFEEALVKLARNKMLQDHRIGTSHSGVNEYKENDDLVSFLLCRKLDFNLDFDFKDIYGDIPRKYWHNFILSIEDGLIGYNLTFSDFPEPMRTDAINRGVIIEKTVVWQYPFHQENDCFYECKNALFSIRKDDNYYHIKMFLNNIVSSINSITLYDTEFLLYSDLQKTNSYK